MRSHISALLLLATFRAHTAACKNLYTHRTYMQACVLLQHEKKSYANACRAEKLRDVYEGNAESRICEIPDQIEAYLVKNL